MTEFTHLGNIGLMITQDELLNFFSVTGWDETRLAVESGVGYMTIRRAAGKDKERPGGVNTAKVQIALEPFLFGDKHPGPKKAAA